MQEQIKKKTHKRNVEGPKRVKCNNTPRSQRLKTHIDWLSNYLEGVVIHT